VAITLPPWLDCCNNPRQKFAEGKNLQVRVYDIATDKFSLSRHMATREGAAIMRGKISEETEVEIDDSLLDQANNGHP
jgi:hypothetical protein